RRPVATGVRLIGLEMLPQVADDELLVEMRPVLAEVVVELEPALREAAAAEAALDSLAEPRVLALDRVDERSDLAPLLRRDARRVVEVADDLRPVDPARVEAHARDVPRPGVDEEVEVRPEEVVAAFAHRPGRVVEGGALVRAPLALVGERAALHEAVRQRLLL